MVVVVVVVVEVVGGVCLFGDGVCVCVCVCVCVGWWVVVLLLPLHSVQGPK